ncbi:YesL family protein [Pseudobutyrivibrio ruminis]|uniref:YesL family protein n=1 Tax=Pseudobutyrivibrio ruminis TaxID=46206 RepID=UPI0004295B90|nr:YesL family protein [Pseudobutyrivibrio ruminis]
MGRFFNSKIFDGITKVTDVMLIGFYFIVCSLPIFTIGASSTALYYAIHKSVFRGRGYTTEFFRSFKDNFKQSTLSWLIFMVLFGVLSADIYVTRNFIQANSPMAAASVFFLVLLIFTIVWSIYHFAYIARFANSFKESFKISAIIMIANIGWSIAIIAVVIVLVLLMYRFMILIVFAPGIFACALHPILEKVFRKYMSAEDIAKEDEDLHY